MNNIHGTERLCQAAFKLASHFDPNLAATIIRDAPSILDAVNLTMEGCT